jgi:hypothetical protein
MVNILRPVACRLGSSSIPIWQIIFWITGPSCEDLFADYPDARFRLIVYIKTNEWILDYRIA